MVLYEEFTCESCRYKFKLKPGSTMNHCPYCGKKNSFRKDITAQELLEDF